MPPPVHRRSRRQRRLLQRWLSLLRRGTVPATLRMVLLAAAIAGAAVATMPDLREQFSAWHSPALWGFVGLLWLDWGFGLWSSWRAGVRPGVYLASSTSWVGLIAAAAAPVALGLGLRPEQAWPLAALAWALKLVPATPGLAHLARALGNEASALRSVLVLFLLVLTIAGVGLYAAESAAQPEAFGNLPAALWWVLVGLVTDSYPDGPMPQTALGGAVAIFVMCAGLGLFGLLTGIIASGFAAEGRRRGFLEARALLARVPFLGGLGRVVVTELAQALRRWDVPEGAVVFRRGQPGEAMYFIAEGEVEVRLEAKALRLGEGAFFGEMALISGAARVATVITTRSSTLLILDAADFHTLVDRHQELAQAVEAEAARRAAENAGLLDGEEAARSENLLHDPAAH
jgi:voltage-gated potassium channel